MTYHLLATWEGDVWAPQFGDRDLECVQQERIDSYLRDRALAYEGDGRYVVADIRIVTFKREPRQAEIIARLASLSATRQMKAVG